MLTDLDVKFKIDTSSTDNSTELIERGCKKPINTAMMMIMRLAL